MPCVTWGTVPEEPAWETQGQAGEVKREATGSLTVSTGERTQPRSSLQFEAFRNSLNTFKLEAITERSMFVLHLYLNAFYGIFNYGKYGNGYGKYGKYSILDQI